MRKDENDTNTENTIDGNKDFRFRDTMRPKSESENFTDCQNLTSKDSLY